MSRDLGRTAVYAAELAAFDGTSYESLAPFDELESLARRITTSQWWPRGGVAVMRARSDAESSSARQCGPDRPTVHLAAPQMTPATLVHELAHVLAGISAGHGPLFRRAHLDLVELAFGEVEAGWLLDAYDSMQLTASSRAWPRPPLSSGRARPVVL